MKGLAARPSMLEMPTMAGPAPALALCSRCGEELNQQCLSPEVDVEHRVP
jgi:hypothetical protein